MKRLFVLFMTVICCFCLVGCGLGSYSVTPGSDLNDQNTGTDTPDTPDTPDAPDLSSHYTVSLYLNNAPYKPGSVAISVIFQSGTAQITVALNSDGTADAGELDDDTYSVRLAGLPEEYGYNPNGYSVTPESRHVDINIMRITAPLDGDGGVHASEPDMAMYRSGGVYIVKYEGMYRAVCEEDRTLYYEFSPINREGGIYSIQSCVSVYDDVVNPVIEIWGGEISYKFKIETRDGGGPALEGGYTKNFRWEINLASSSVGASFTFGVKAESKSGKYPVNVDFEIKHEGAYNPSYEIVEVVIPKESQGMSKAAESDSPFVYADFGTKLFDGRNFRYDPDYGLYRVYDEVKYADNNGFGPYLCAAINTVVPAYSITSLYNANSVGLGSNFLQLFGWSDKYNDTIKYDYTDFIRVYYAAKCNSAGYCYVTKELKEFLQAFAAGHALWTDGVSPSEGSPEDNGYNATQDDLWLFACGFYDE